MTFRLRAFVSALVALAFLVAATPGSMAMPQPVKSAAHTMAMPDDGSSGQAGYCCDHMKADPAKGQPGQNQPCKTMAICLGMLSCFGMGAVDLTVPLLLMPPRDAPMGFVHDRVSGLAHRPDNPPPIL